MRSMDVINTLDDSANALDLRHVYFFNKELNCILRSTSNGEIGVFRPKEVEGKSYLGLDIFSFEINKIIGLEEINEGFLENHISPDGKHILICSDGLKIYKFEEEKTESHRTKILIKPTEWVIPLKT